MTGDRIFYGSRHTPCAVTDVVILRTAHGVCLLLCQNGQECPCYVSENMLDEHFP